ncbi:3503_t:CDS:2, partial [Rhizophagus irregularis]
MSQTNSLLALFNTDTLRPIAIQKLDILTQELWYPGIPQDINKYIEKISTPSYLSKSLALIEQYQIHLDLTVSYENDFTLSNYRMLTYPLTDNYSIPTRLQNIPELSLGSHKKYNEWTYHWNASIQNCVIGKTYLQDTETHSSISTMEHYIPINNSLLVNDPSFQSSRSSPLILIPCMGCHLNDYSLVLQDARIKCTISIRINRLSVFNIFHHSNQVHKRYANLLLKKYFVSTKPLHFIRYSAHSIYLAQHNINTITPVHTSLSANSQTSDNDDIIKQLTLPIQSALLCKDFIKSSLIDIAKKFLPFTNFEFYSDGSVSNI